jgi:hypothetical protein
MTFACSILPADALPANLQAAEYMGHDDTGTDVAGFVTESPGCGAEETNLFVTTLMSQKELDCGLCKNNGTAAEEQAILATADRGAFLSDAEDSNFADYAGAGSSDDAGDGSVANARLIDISDVVRALLFSVKM